jgi:2-(3-amino-3-carboxypropyl)histidine synthase
MFDEKRKNSILKRIKGFRRIYLQIPEGLKTSVQDLVAFLESEGFTVFLSVEPCFGACDLREHEARMLKCDVILHIGHSDFGVRTKMPIIYEHYGIDINAKPFLKRHIRELKKFRNISLITTVQFESILEDAKEFLKKEGINVVKTGTILGCRWHPAVPADKKVGCHLFMGSGRFHPYGLQINVEKPVLGIDLETGELTDYRREKGRYEIKRRLRIEKAREAENFGVLISSKPGQLHLGRAEKAKKHLDGSGKKAFFLVANMITPDKLLGMKIDVLVNTACPRIAEDGRMFGKTILDFDDAMEI